MPALTYDKNGNVLGTPPDLSPTEQSSAPNTSVIQAKIKNSAQHYGVDPNLALAVAKQESSFNPKATSKAGAQGVMQLMPETAKNYGVTDPFNADQNIDAGTRYLADLQKKHNGDKAKMLIEYNSGPNNVNKDFQDLPTETQDYLTNILGPGARSQGTPTVYDKNGNIVGSNLSQSPFQQQRQTYNPQQVQAQKNLQNVNQSNVPYYLNKAAEYAPEVLGTVGGLVPGYPTLGSAAGAGLGEILAGSAEHGVPNQEDFKRALEGAGSSLLLGGLFKLPGALRNQVVKSIEGKATKAGDLLENARQDLTGGIPSGDTTGAQDVLKAKLAPVKQEENDAWEKVNDRLDKSSHVFDAISIDPTTGKSTTTPTTIRGPIKLSKQSLDYINSEKTRLEQIISKFPSASNVRAYQQLDQAQKAVVQDQQGNAYAPFDAVKSLRSDIGKSVSNEQQSNLGAAGKSIGIQSGSRIQSGLRNTLGDDIDSSLLDIGGPDALKDYGNAVGMTKTRIKASLFDKVLENRTNQATGMLDVDSAINDLTKGTSKYSTQFTGAEKKNLVDALLATKNVSPQYDGGLKFSNGQWLFTGYYATRHPLKFAVSVATKDLFERALENPKYARIIAQLPSAPKSASQTQTMTKSLFKGMLQSTPAEMIAPSGMRVKAHIDQNGEPQPDFKM